ncbi:MAG: hypothetical protein AMXMBFR78_07360 [Rubrivivax sp.]
MLENASLISSQENAMAFKRFRSAAAALLTCSAAVVAAAPVQWTSASGGNDHWYERVTPATVAGYTWDEAYADAPTRSWMGLTGYMATVTSQAEQNFLIAAFGIGGAWLGGNDRATEGTWQWVNGPEAGQTFYIAGAGSQPGYSNWNTGEPNNCCSGEDDLVYGYFGDAAAVWNDYGVPSFPNARYSYFVEYSGQPGTSVPEPATLALVGVGLLLAARRRRA